MDIKGECFGIRVRRADYEWKGEMRKHVICQMLVEDDGIWHEKDLCFDPEWIDDIRSVLLLSKEAACEVLKEGKSGGHTADCAINTPLSGIQSRSTLLDGNECDCGYEEAKERRYTSSIPARTPALPDL